MTTSPESPLFYGFLFLLVWGTVGWVWLLILDRKLKRLLSEKSPDSASEEHCGDQQAKDVGRRD